jgi:hypothetical protein
VKQAKDRADVVLEERAVVELKGAAARRFDGIRRAVT